MRNLLRDTRGGAMVETVIMIPIFIVIWACVVFIYQAYEKRIDLLQATRADAWDYATNSCRDRPVGDTRISTSDHDIDGIVGTVFSILGASYYDGPLRELEASRDDEMDEPEILGGETLGMRYRMELMCNEEPQELGDDLHYEAWVMFGLPEIL
jgi:hypothetical protein